MHYHQLRVKSWMRYFTIFVFVNVLCWSFVSLWLTAVPVGYIPKVSQNVARYKGSYVQRFPFSRTGLNRKLVILLWTTWFGDSKWALDKLSDAFSTCPVSDCVLTADKSDIVRSDVVLFNAMDLWNYFFGCSLPDYRRRDQVWILENMEPPPHSPLAFEKYNGVFNWTATYRSDSDVYRPYIVTENQSSSKQRHGDIASTKSAGIAWVASNCGDDARRQLLVREINKYFPVDAYGRCGDKTLPDEDMDTVLKKYKFYLSFENSYCRDYITEKFAATLNRNIIPVVAGGGDYKTVAPPHSYIAVSDFSSVKDLVDYLKYLDSNNTAYNSYFDWTNDFKVSSPWYERRWCKMCEALHDERRPFQVYTDLAGYIEDDTCVRWTIPRYLHRIIQGYAIKTGVV